MHVALAKYGMGTRIFLIGVVAEKTNRREIADAWRHIDGERTDVEVVLSVHDWRGTI